MITIHPSVICLVQNHPTCKKVWGSQSGVGEQKETGGKKAILLCCMLNIFAHYWNVRVS